MPIKFRRNVIKISRTNYVNLPKEIMEYFDLKVGDSLILYVEDDKLIIEVEEKK